LLISVALYPRLYYVFLQVMIDFQAAEKKRLEEPASEIGLEPLCAMVSVILFGSIGLLFQHRIAFC